MPTLRCNVKALQENTYKLVGEMLATMAVQGGPLPQLFDDVAVEYIIKCTLDLRCDIKCLSDPENIALRKVC